MIQKEYDQVMRIMILGDSFVGKSSLISKYLNGNFHSNLPTTIGIDYKNKKIKKRGINLKIQLWDTAGEERYHSLTNISIRDADVVLLTYDITSQQTFQTVKDKWIDMAQNRCRKNTIMVLVGTKKDLDALRQVKFETGNDLAQENNFAFYETSAKENQNIDKMFDYLAETFIERIEEERKRTSAGEILLEKESNSGKSCSCGFFGLNWGR